LASRKTIERLSLYRRYLKMLKDGRIENVYSHKLADVVAETPAVVRRDLMNIGYSGSPKLGYKVNELLSKVDEFFHSKDEVKVIIVGVGNLGRALMQYFAMKGSNIKVIAGFDADTRKTNRVISNCHCYHINDLPKFVKETGVTNSIITVPESAAQITTDLLVSTGIKGILNFSPTRLKVPTDVYVEDVDITMMIERTIYFSMENSMRT
jgi:redox-sensing transcriptional repressor